MKFALLKEDVSSLKDDQVSAVFEALVAAVIADGKAEPSEIGRLEHELEQVDWGRPRDTLVKVLADARMKVSALASREAVEAFVKNVAERLSTPAVREKVFRTMASITYADRNINQAEDNILTAFRDAFAISKERLDEIAAEVRA